MGGKLLRVITATVTTALAVWGGGGPGLRIRVARLDMFVSLLDCARRGWALLLPRHLGKVAARLVDSCKEAHLPR